MLETIETNLAGVYLITPPRHRDDRGFFSEVYNRKALADAGVDADFVQDNHSLSRDAGVVRGLHFQIPPRPIAKLVRVIRGAVSDVVVDLRDGSPTFGEHFQVELSDSNWTQIYVPVGFAHGFCTLTRDTEISYKVTDYWSSDVDRGLLWNDPELGIEWPVHAGEAILSDKDRNQPRLSELPTHFKWSEA